MIPDARSLIDFTRLRVDKDTSKGIAPHKPLLLLAVLDLVESGHVAKKEILLSPELVVRFQNFWPIVAERRANRGDIRLPFHALANDGLWNVYDGDGRISKAKQTSTRAVLSDWFWLILQNETSRRTLRHILIAHYFPQSEQVSLAEALGIDPLEFISNGGIVNESQGDYQVRRALGRSARFKTEVVTGYFFTCALTGYRITTADQLSIVEAAHIHALSKSLNNDAENGLALSPTAHALFDLGLWSIRDDFTIIVKSESSFTETFLEGSFSLRAFANKPLHIDRRAKLRPHSRHLRWHRSQHGLHTS